MVFNWLKNLFVDSPEKAIEKAALNSDVFKIGRQVFEEVFDDKSQGLGKYSKEDLKNALATQLSSLMGSILTSKNPLLTNRQIICDGVIGQAKFGVLVTEEEILGSRNSALKGLPIVSGKLKDHFMEIAEKDDEIKDLKRSLKDISQESLHVECLYRYWVYSLKVKAFNDIRAAAKEVNEFFPVDMEKDWFFPLVESQLAWQETQFRKMIGLKNILDTDEIQGALKAVQCYTLIKFVVDGEKYPYLKWEEAYKKDFAED